MKKCFVTLLTGYQIFLSPIFKLITGNTRFCRFNPTCSEFAITAVEKYGVAKGLSMALVRLMQCQPFSHSYESI